jgi:hypothetical protein
MLIKMKHADTGHEVDVHPDMVADYAGGGYREIEIAKPETLRKTEAAPETETPAPVRRGRPRKAD